MQEEKYLFKKRIKIIKESMDLISGKWKLPILCALLNNQNMRFSDLQNELQNIGPKMLSKELQDLEINQLIKKVTSDKKPYIVNYQPTLLAYNLFPIINNMSSWNLNYKSTICQNFNK